MLEGIVFFILSIFNVREKLVRSIPLGVRIGISPAIGLMLLDIGFGSHAGVYSETGGPFYVMSDFFSSLTPSVAKNDMGSGYEVIVFCVITMFVGVFTIAIMFMKGVKAAVLLGMLIACGVYWVGSAVFLGDNPFIISIIFLVKFFAVV